jgi:tetratricopeptide (TPR) repeat protein
VVVADQLLNDKHYGKAGGLYHELLELNESNVYLKLRMAETCVGLHNAREARDWYTQVFQKKGHDVPADALPVHIYQYAEILLSDGKPDEALYWYELYQQRNPADSRTARKIAGIKRMTSLEKPAAGFEVGGTSLNSKYADFSPSFYDKGVVFVSARARAEAKNGGNADETFLDLYYSAFLPDGSFGEVRKFSDAINTSFNEGPSVFFGADRRMIFTRNHLKGKLKTDEDVVIQLQLFQSDLDTTTATWKKPELLSINSDT